MSGEFSQKKELIKSVAASQADLSLRDIGTISSHRDQDRDSRRKPSERAAKLDDIESLEEMDLLRDKIFQRLQKADNDDKRGALSKNSSS